MATSTQERPGPDAPSALADEQVRELRRRIVESVERVCPRWLSSDREDIAHNVLLALLDSIARRGGGNRDFASIYLRKAAHGATVDEIRRRVRRRETGLDAAAGIDRMPTPREDPERASTGREMGRAIVDCLRRLIVPRRLAVTLFLRGCSVPETSRRLGWTPKRAEHLVYRGLAEMRRCLAAKGWSP